MRSLVIVAVLAAAGCNKKPKETQPDTAPPPPVAGGPKQQPANTGGPNVGVIPSGVAGGVVTNPGAVTGGGGSGGAVQAVRKAARRTQALNEMNTLGQVISLMQTDLGRMPTKEQIVAELKQYPKLQEAVTEGAFILTGTTEAGGLWAYEVEADVKAGIALIGGKAARTTPDELAPYFRKN
jgi:hypothetical protein